MTIENSIANLDNIVKDVYAESVDLMERDDWFYASIDNAVPVSTVSGNKVLIPFTASQAFAQWMEKQDYPNASSIDGDTMEVRLAQFYSMFKLTDYQMNVLQKGDVLQKRETITDIVSQIIEAPKDEMTRLFFADKYGSFGTVNTAGSSSTTVQLTWWSGVPSLEVGRTVQIGTPSEIEGGTADVVKVVAVDEDTITVDKAIDTAEGDTIVDQFAFEGGEWHTFSGIEWIADDTTDYGNIYQGKDRTSNYKLKGNRMLGTTNVLTDIDNALRKVVLGGKTNNLVVVAGLDKYDEIVKSLIADRTKTTNGVNDLELTGGWTGIKYIYNGKPVKIVASAYAKNDRIYVYDTSALAKTILTDNSLINEAGGYLERKGVNFYLIGRLYGHIIGKQPRKTAKIIY